MNNTFSKPLPIETYKIKSVWRDFGSDNGQPVFKKYVVDLEGDAYKDDPSIRSFEFKPVEKYVTFNFGDGLFGIKVLKEKKLSNEKIQNLPSGSNNLIDQVNSLLEKKDTAGIRILLKDMQEDK